MPFNIFTDTNLTSPFVPPLVFQHDSDDSTGDVDTVLYIGNLAAGKQIQADSNPGVDQIIATVVDNNVDPGNSPEATDIKLATSSLGLDTAIAGDPLNLGLTIASGAGNKVEIHIRASMPVAPVGDHNELSIETNQLRET